MRLLTKAQRKLLNAGQYEAVYAAMKPQKPRTPIKRKARTKASRERIYGTDEHQAWLRAMPCLGCALMGTDERPHHLHHTKNGGTGRKADASRQVPLCALCHGFLHQHGPTTFESVYADMLAGRTLASWAEQYAKGWKEWTSQPETRNATESRGRTAETARSDDEGGLGARGADRPQVRSGARPSANLAAAGHGHRRLTPLSAIVPGVVRDILEGAD